MEPEKPKPKIEPPQTFTTQDAVSIIVVSVLVGAVVFGGIYHLHNLLKRRATQRPTATVTPEPPTIPPAREQRPTFVATQFKQPALQVASERNQKVALPRKSAGRTAENLSADDLLGLPSREDYDYHCGPGYQGHGPCEPGQRSLISNFADTVKKLP